MSRGRVRKCGMRLSSHGRGTQRELVKRLDIAETDVEAGSSCPDYVQVMAAWAGTSGI